MGILLRQAIEVVADLAETYIDTIDPTSEIEHLARLDHIEALERVRAFLKRLGAFSVR